VVQESDINRNKLITVMIQPWPD